MKLWQKIRGLLRTRRDKLRQRGQFVQSQLRTGRIIQHEQLVAHVVSVAFARPDVDDATYRLLGDRDYWRMFLKEDLAAAIRDDSQIRMDDFLLAMLDAEALGAVLPPQPCPPIPLDSLPYMSVGYNELMLDLAERCDQMLGFAVIGSNSASARVAWPLVHHLARLAAKETGGLILDHHSQRWWSLDRWQAVNPYPGHGAIGDWVVVHDVVDKSGPANLHTHGMAHFGLPDLEMVNVPRFHRTGAGKMLNGACWKLILQGLTEGRRLRVNEEIEISGDDLRDSMRLSDAAESTEGVARIRLVPGDPVAAQVENRLLRILPAASYGEGTEALAACLLELFPEEDTLGEIADERAMQLAHRRALASLPAERERFRRGLRPGERLAVKARFPYGNEGGNEYMWVEVQDWNGEGHEAAIEGVLLNQPVHVPALKLGQSLRVEHRAIYDWLRVTPGGRQEGNFTAAALE
ncbi:MAG TPA: DUF2314 domain-containing protein [Planctomycetaceae bacterium]|jgi:uncharacterized protein YegJ (DUF2314 family)